MGKPNGGMERAPKNKVSALRDWLAEYKLAGSEWGCRRCGEHKEAPNKLLWIHRDMGERDFRISAGPAMAGMTRERLEAEARKCSLVCRQCRANDTMPARCGPPEETLRERATKLVDFLGPAVQDALVATDPPALLLGDLLYIRAS